MPELVHVPLDALLDERNPRGVRMRFADLTSSIAVVGLRTPLEVYRLDGGDDFYYVLNGGRRLRALRRLRDDGASVPDLDFDRIPCYCRDRVVTEEDDVLIARLAANLQDDPPVSCVADAVKEIMLAEHFTLRQVAAAIGYTQNKVRLLILLADAPIEVKRKVDRGEMSLTAFHHWLNAPERTQTEIAESDQSYTVSEVRRAADRARVEDAPETLPDVMPDVESTVEWLNAAYARLNRVILAGMNVRERAVMQNILALLMAAGIGGPTEVEQVELPPEPDDDFDEDEVPF